ncbi:hypothetical protein JTB14_015287 [Gonioctena quinquepunctata]|nr:hypothetical protein JTB14_015287 [Gonioctena quinquepunctata]
MSRSRKSTAAEAKLKKKEYDRKRREKLKNCPETLEKLREKERLKYLKKKEKGQVKSVSAMSSRERRQKQKQWRLNSPKYREKNQNVRKNLERLMNETPAASPVSPAKPSSRVNAVKNETVALRRRRQLRNRRAILYGRIAKLEKNVKEEVRKSEKYRKKYTRENYCCKYWEEIQAVHFGGGRQQVTLHTGVFYLKNPDDTVKAQSFCTLSDNNRHDSIAVWAHLKPIFDWLENQRPNIHAVHILSDSPVNQYRNKFVFHIVSHHLKYFLPDINNFTWNYSEPGHGKGAPDGVGGTLKRSADQAVAEGKDVTDLNVLKNVLIQSVPQ